MPRRPTRKRKPESHPTRSRTSTGKNRPQTITRSWWRRKRNLIALFVLFSTAYVIYLDVVIRINFEGKRWSLPAQVYARPLELYPGLQLSPVQFNQELERLGYRYSYRPDTPGTYSRQEDQFHLVTRPFQFWDGKETSRQLQIRFAGGQVVRLHDAERDTELPLARMEPPHIGGIYPAHHEDRILIKLDEVPQVLVNALVSVEDRNFATHIGLDWRAIARAFWANIKAVGTVQGGSTLTQQLVKNFFLSNERTLWRKANEAIMALLLEWHYDKNEILEAYLNEVYLGQDGGRAIHGFGLASWFYFDKPITKLTLPESAVLVALIRGPGYYHPYRHADRLLQRRNLVLELMAGQGVISATDMLSAKQSALGVIHEQNRVTNAYPAFMDLLRRQLKQDYREKDLTSEGLRIFTTLDPWIQQTLEKSVRQQLKLLDRKRGLDGRLQTAAIVTNTTSGEVLAMVGDRQPNSAGFNRALDAQRPVGSLIKPAVYLTALQQTEQYNLLSLIDDEPIIVQEQGGKTWTPKNYDGESHGQVPLYRALVQSYNQATVRLGMGLGFEAIAENLHRLGVERRIPPYPSMLLGAVDMSPFDITQMYQTIASGGFRTPLRTIRDVLTVKGEPLQRYPLHLEQVIDNASIQVLTSALQAVMQTGTGRAIKRYVKGDTGFAGKTGTTDELRDSWFAGFGRDYLAVVWLGTDDNQPINLSGSSGALTLWGDMMARLHAQPLQTSPSDEVERLLIDTESLLVANEGCDKTVSLAFIKGTSPTRFAPCAGGGRRD